MSLTGVEVLNQGFWSRNGIWRLMGRGGRLEEEDRGSGNVEEKGRRKES